MPKRVDVASRCTAEFRELQLLPKMMQVIRAKEWGLTIVSGGPLAAGQRDRG